MCTRTLLNPILDNDRLTQGLGDAEARILIEWLVERVEVRNLKETDTKRLCRRGRAIARFVSLWCHERLAEAALQLAATERFGWPLPMEAMDACDLMDEILTWESARSAI